MVTNGGADSPVQITEILLPETPEHPYGEGELAVAWWAQNATRVFGSIAPDVPRECALDCCDADLVWCCLLGEHLGGLGEAARVQVDRKSHVVQISALREMLLAVGLDPVDIVAAVLFCGNDFIPKLGSCRYKTVFKAMREWRALYGTPLSLVQVAGNDDEGESGCLIADLENLLLLRTFILHTEMSPESQNALAVHLFGADRRPTVQLNWSNKADVFKELLSFYRSEHQASVEDWYLLCREKSLTGDPKVTAYPEKWLSLMTDARPRAANVTESLRYYGSVSGFCEYPRAFISLDAASRILDVAAMTALDRILESGGYGRVDITKGFVPGNIGFVLHDDFGNKEVEQRYQEAVQDRAVLVAARHGLPIELLDVLAKAHGVERGKCCNGKNCKLRRCSSCQCVRPVVKGQPNPLYERGCILFCACNGVHVTDALEDGDEEGEEDGEEAAEESGLPEEGAGGELSGSDDDEEEDEEGGEGGDDEEEVLDPKVVIRSGLADVADLPPSSSG